MTKQVRGMKRNQIIQRWLNGIDDPDYEVFPTKKEGKYIIKPRKKLDEPTAPHKVEPEAPVVIEPDEPPSDSIEGLSEEPFVKPRQITHRHQTNDTTINLEILEQLRSLGEELRNDRFKKEQKQYIKHVVNKELNKSYACSESLCGSRIRSKYNPELRADDQPNIDSPPITAEPQAPITAEPQAPITAEPIVVPDDQPVFRSRIRR